jgi:D-xylose transport system substrate-binding protein
MADRKRATGKAPWSFVLMAAALLAALVLAACGDDDDDDGGGETDGEGGTIALLLPESKTTRYEEQDRPNFERRVEEICPDCEVLYSNANNDPAAQQQQAEAAITQGAQVIVISAVDVVAASTIVQRANDAGVDVIAYGRLIPDADISHYVSIDPFEVGQQQAEVLMDELDRLGVENPRVVMINGAPTDSNSKPYKDGATEVLEQRGASIEVSYDTPDWSPDEAQREMEQAITRLGADGIDGVYVANDGMAGGAIAAMKGADIDPAEVPVTGQDAELAAVQRILAGEQLMTVYQPITDIAESSAELAVPLAQGEEPPADAAPAEVDNGAEMVPSVLLETIAITDKNVDVLIDDGFLEEGDICSGAYVEACRGAGLG